MRGTEKRKDYERRNGVVSLSVRDEIHVFERLLENYVSMQAVW